MKIWRLLKKLKELTFTTRSSISISEEYKETKLKNIYVAHVHCSTICNSQDMEAHKCLSVDEWIKMGYVCVCVCDGILFSHKKWNLVIFTTWIDLQVKWNKSEKEKKILCDFTYMWNVKSKTNKQTKLRT